MSIQRGRHNRAHRNSQWKWEFEFETILLRHHWYYSDRIQPPVFAVLCLSSNLCVLFHRHRITFSTRKNYNLCFVVNSTTKSISEDLLNAETTTVKSIASSKFPDVLLNETPVWIWTSFWNGFGSTKELFPPYLLLSAGLIIGVSTATCETSLSSVVWIPTPYRIGAWHTTANVS